jgi:hypothetical protein
MQHHLFHPPCPNQSMQADMATWPMLGVLGDLSRNRIVAMVPVYPANPAMIALLLERPTPHGPHRWHIVHVQGHGFVGSQAGWTDADGRSLLPRSTGSPPPV